MGDVGNGSMLGRSRTAWPGMAQERGGIQSSKAGGIYGSHRQLIALADSLPCDRRGGGPHVAIECVEWAGIGIQNVRRGAHSLSIAGDAGYRITTIGPS